MPNSEFVLSQPYPHLVSRALSGPYVRWYWCVFLLMALTAVYLHWRNKRRLQPIVIVLICEIGLISGLFLFWGTRISGELYAFNGFFIYSIQFIAFWVMAALILEQVPINIQSCTSTLAACYATLLVA